MIHHEGGGWCYDETSCKKRSPAQRSSKTYTDTLDVEGLYDSLEPRFAAANFVYVRYCSSDAYAGDTTASWGGFEFRGAEIARAVVADVLTAQGLGAAPTAQVMYGGCSAGARGSLFNGDKAFAQLSSALGGRLARFGVLFDSGFWVDVDPFDDTLMSLRDISRAAVAMANMGPQASPECAAAHAGDELWKCFFGQYALPFLKSSFFAHAFLYDLYQLEKDGLPGRPKSDAEDGYSEAFRAQMSGQLRPIWAAQPDAAAMLPACHKHCNTLKGNTWSTIAVGGLSLEDAVAEWFFRDNDFSEHRWTEDTCSGWDCGPCAHAHSPPPTPPPTTSRLTPTVQVSVADQQPAFLLDDHYLGYNLDTGSLHDDFDLSDPVLAQLLRNLAPGQLRVGGSAADSMWYLPRGGEGGKGKGPSPDPLAPNFAAASQPGYTGYLPEVTFFSDATLDGMSALAASAGMDLLLGLNSVDFRAPGGGWAPAANTSALLDAVVARGLTVANWQLGNEPDIYGKHFGADFALTGAQVAADLLSLVAQLRARGLSTSVTALSLATFNQEILSSFLDAWMAAGGGKLSLAVHRYPYGGPTYAPDAKKPTCSDDTFLNLTKASGISAYLASFADVVAKHGDPASTRLVLEEVASHSLGGCAGWSDRFASAFWWVHALALVGEAGWHQVNRQDIAGLSFTNKHSQYQLLGQPGWLGGAGLVGEDSPNPDYWVSLLFSRLMGRTVLSSSTSASGVPDGSLGVHVWCTAPGAPGAQSGAVTVAFAQTSLTAVLAFFGGASGAGFPSSPRIEFILTSDSLTSHSTLLNGEKLRAGADGTLPPLPGREVTDGSPLLLPPRSAGFIVLPYAAAPACE